MRRLELFVSSFARSQFRSFGNEVSEWRRGMKQEQLESDHNIVPPDKKLHVIFLLTSASAAMVYLNGDGVVVVEMVRIDIKGSSYAEEPYKLRKQALYVFLVQDIPCHGR